MGILRKNHSKSKSGCLQCKRRRIKCNEDHPTCGYCMKKNYTCDYSTKSHHISRNDKTQSNGIDLLTPKSGKSINFYSSSLSYLTQLLKFVDDELPFVLAKNYGDEMLHYRKIFKGLSIKIDDLEFIHHMMIALAGICKFHSAMIPDLNYYYISRYHFSVFLHDYKKSLAEEALNGVADDDFIPHICAAVLVPTYCLLADDIKLSNPLYYKMTKDGVNIIAKANAELCQKFYQNNSDWRLVALLKKPVADFNHTYGFPVYLNDKLMIANIGDDDHVVDKSVYKSALTALYNCYRYQDSSLTQVITSFFVHWALAADDEFVESLHRKDPRSIIITLELLKFISVNLTSTDYTFVWKKILLKELEDDFEMLPQCWKSWYKMNSPRRSILD